MTDGRERDIIHAFVGLSNELVEEYDVVEMLSLLTMNCAGLLNVASAGLLLADGQGTLHLVASSSERTHHLEVFQLQREEGPCLDCYAVGEPVIVPDLATEERRWPQFCGAAVAAGFRSVHALPMRLRETPLGTLGLFGVEVGQLDDDDLALAQALVHVASVAIVNERSAADLATVNAQLQHALTSRIVLEQAKGVIAHTAGVEMEDAFAILRRYARDHGRRLSEVAAEVVNRELPGQALLDHARSAALLP
ncbi:GAF and ANTAR domain-containing protein [Nocardioides sp. LMS-CY]|uniref:GAF and ANTAR domain-containing protein n=1 Tax=Nocardioides sp. (strain LMS-CY) TaxID=2840457 RepID=UPI001C007DD8|nr:GAF and ANTAR domain-containing protein [Nocardioides sp. LMS-CY]QWF20207.1 GAF and ANTAR domain-containing protein [Nocardioides sp. LMS-CY]